MMERKQLLFYGWGMVALTVAGNMILYGVRHSFSVFFSPILDEFGWSRGITAIMFSLNVLVYGLLAPLGGWLVGRWRPRTVVCLGILLVALASAGCGMASRLWHFYVLFGLLVPLGTAFSGWPVSGTTLMNWFATRRGLVLGLGQMGGGLSFVFGIFSEFAIVTWGWRNAYGILAAILVVFLLPLYHRFFRYRPEDKGLQTYGTSPRDQGIGARMRENPVPRTQSLGEILKAPRLWILVISKGLYWGLGCYLVLAHQVKFAEDVGYSSFFAVSVFGLFGVTLFLGQFSGFLSDRLGRERTGTLAALCSIGALFALIAVRDTSHPSLLYVYAILFGYGNGLYSPTLFAASADLFYGKYYGVVMGLLLAGMGVGGAIGPWLGGFLFDLSGDYRTAFVVAAVSIGLGCATLWVAAPRKILQGKR